VPPSNIRKLRRASCDRGPGRHKKIGRKLQRVTIQRARHEYRTVRDFACVRGWAPPFSFVTCLDVAPQWRQTGPLGQTRASSHSRAFSSSWKIGFWRLDMARSLLECWCLALTELLADGRKELADVEHFGAASGAHLGDGSTHESRSRRRASGGPFRPAYRACRQRLRLRRRR
jgi:hypothetical protein